MELLKVKRKKIEGNSIAKEKGGFVIEVLLNQYGKIDVQTSVMIIVVPLVPEV